HYAADAEAILELLDLRAHRRRVGRFAIKHLDRNRQSVSCAQQPIHDLWAITAVITAVAMLRQRTTATLEIRRTHVVEHQDTILEIPPSKAVLNPLLAFEQPVQCLV